MENYFKILAIGDVVGSCGVKLLEEKLWKLRDEHGISLTVVNGENSADGNGMLPKSLDAILDAGADIITGGNHSFRRREVYNYLDDSGVCVRPANMPSTTPGYGYKIIDSDGLRVLVINLLGTMFLDPIESPFTCADRILKDNAGKYDISVIDLHAEATSEKAALARYLDGRASIVFGTHTHVPTSDTRVLPNGTGFVTDLGMTGAYESILGVKSDIVIEKFLTSMPVRFEQESSEPRGDGVIFTLDRSTKKCIKVERISF